MLHVHRAERADRLADGLATTLTTPLDDPFMADVVAVPTRGIERWLAQRLSTRLGVTEGREDGICANVDFPFPHASLSAPSRQRPGSTRTTTPGDPSTSSGRSSNSSTSASTSHGWKR